MLRLCRSCVSLYLYLGLQRNKKLPSPMTPPVETQTGEFAFTKLAFRNNDDDDDDDDWNQNEDEGPEWMEAWTWKVEGSDFGDSWGLNLSRDIMPSGLCRWEEVFSLAIPLRCLSFSVCIQTCKTPGHSYTSISPFCICTLYCAVRRKHHNSNQ